jgi:hypothetical protein
LLAERKREATRSWLDVWKSYDPEHLQIEIWQERLEEPRGWASRLFGQRR